MSEFTNWKNKITIEESIALDKRAEEIKDLINNKQQHALIKIAEKQVEQKIQQDKRNLTTNKIIAPGTMVMLKNEGLLKKLDDRCKGPFIVEKQTKNYNYLLRDRERTVPRHKLKPIDLKPSETTHYLPKKRGRPKKTILLTSIG